MVKSTIITAIAAAMAIIPTAAFVAPIPSTPLTHGSCSSTTMSMSKSTNDDRAQPMMHKIAATAALAGACVLANVFTANVAFAMDESPAQFDFGPTSTIIAGRGGGGRGGGRAMGGGGGGRSMGGGGMSRGGGASYARPQVRNYSSTTYIQRPGIGISPFGYGMGYGYNPLGGVGLGYGLGAASNIGNQMTDNRQEGEIQSERIQLEEAKFKAAQLEARLELLEKRTGEAAPTVQALPQALQVQPTVQAQPPAVVQ